jgi:hypothetical protein
LFLLVLTFPKSPMYHEYRMIQTYLLYLMSREFPIRLMSPRFRLILICPMSRGCLMSRKYHWCHPNLYVQMYQRSRKFPMYHWFLTFPQYREPCYSFQR